MKTKALSHLTSSSFFSLLHHSEQGVRRSRRSLGGDRSRGQGRTRRSGTPGSHGGPFTQSGGAHWTYGGCFAARAQGKRRAQAHNPAALAKPSFGNICLSECSRKGKHAFNSVKIAKNEARARLTFCVSQAMAPGHRPPQDSLLAARQVFSGLPEAVGQNPMLLSNLMPSWQQQIGGTTITTFLPSALDLSMFAASAQRKPPISLPTTNLPNLNLRSVVNDALSKYTEQTARKSPQHER